MKELGEYLRETREKNCVGIEEAAEDLKISENILENMEKGNSRAFRDMLELKDRVKEYAKYLGLDPEKVVDDFNDFLFEHTSKISLSDILEAEKKEKPKKIVSPYTKIKIKKSIVTIKKIKIAMIVILFILIIAFIIRRVTMPDKSIINRELKVNIEMRGV